jgi:hypothetical protein
VLKNDIAVQRSKYYTCLILVVRNTEEGWKVSRFREFRIGTGHYRLKARHPITQRDVGTSFRRNPSTGLDLKRFAAPNEAEHTVDYGYGIRDEGITEGREKVDGAP